MSAGLAHESAFGGGFGPNGLSVGHSWLTDVGFYFILALHSVGDDVQMKLAHPRNDRLARFIVVYYFESRILIGHLDQRVGQFVLLAPRFRLDGD